MSAPFAEPVRSLYDLPFSALEQKLAGDGVRPVHTRALWRAMYRDLESNFSDRSDFAAPLARWLSNDRFSQSGCTDRLQVVADIASTDAYTRKFLLKLRDGQTIETVLMDYPGRSTACLSTQAGCAMACSFCATGQMGFVRHLSAAEIVLQVWHCQRELQEQGKPGLRNLVLMGMGEPLHNYDAVMTALEIITDTRGFNIGPSRITISTVGMIPGILRLANERRPYNLAVSLHSATQDERAALMPVAQRWPLPELLEACRTYSTTLQRRIFFEWTLIAGQNDSPIQAERLAALLEGLDAHINLIPLNPTSGFHGGPAAAAAAEVFKTVLQAAGFPCTIRQRRGIDVAAGCGQLQAERKPTAVPR